MDYAAYPPNLRAIMRLFDQEITTLFQALRAGELLPEDWRSATQRVIAKYLPAAMMAGAKSPDLLPEQVAAIQERLGVQLGYFNNFADILERGVAMETEFVPTAGGKAGANAQHYLNEAPQTPWKQYESRLRSYVRAAVAPYWIGATGALPLPAVPGDPSTQCQQNCKCKWEIRPIRADRGDFDCYWRMNHPAEHCFPPGTLITTAHGLRPIEAIRVGELVQTRHGFRRVTKLFRNPQRGPLVEVVSGSHRVRATPNHPFFTQRGWVRADQLRSSDQVLLYQQGLDPVWSDITLPQSDYREPASGQIGILGSVPVLLRQLARSEGREARVSMPVFPIRLDNQGPDPNIHDKMGFDQERRLVSDLAFIQDGAQSQLQLAGLITLEFLLGLDESFGTLGRFFRMIGPIIQHLLEGVGIAHRIVGGHVLGSALVNDRAGGILSQDQMEPIGLISDRDRIETQGFTHLLTSIARVVRDQVRNLIAAPAERGGFGWFRWFRFPGPQVALADGSIAAQHATVKVFAHSAGWEALAAQGTDGLHPGSGLHIPMIPQYVYNLEVEDEHVYIANGFLVHNCQTCKQRARDWNPLQVRDWQLVLRDAVTFHEVSRSLKQALAIAGYDSDLLRDATLKHLGSQHDQKTHGSWASGTPAPRSRLEEKLAMLETHTEFINSRRERAYVFSPDGDILILKTGREHFVEFSDEEISKMKDATLAHNHSIIGMDSFSPDDVAMAVHADLKEMRVLTYHGTYILTRPKDGWSFVTSTNVYAFFERNFSWQEVFSTDRASGSRRLEQVWEKFAQETGAEYRYIKRNP